MNPKIPSKTCADWKQLFQGQYPGKPSFTEDKYPDLKGKVVIVTGGNSGVGYQTVKSLAGSTEARIYIFSRNEQKSLDAIAQIRKEVAQEYKVFNPDIHFVKVDLSDLTTVKPAVEEFCKRETRLDIIIHNAGVLMPPTGSKSAQGYELQLGTNVIGPHLLQRLLDPIFIKTSKTNKPGESRIVWVSSSFHFFAPQGGFFWDDLNYEQVKSMFLSRYYAVTLYGQSKAGTVIQARTWSLKHNAPNVISSSVCPGYLKTGLQKDCTMFEKVVFWLTLHPARYGAYTELFAALSPDVKNRSHSIAYGRQSHVRKDLMDEKTCDKVWKYLDKVTDTYV
ncbi:uncharacterized protein SPAPADRAFT_157463 [Spathaspora passalidarum NRRL Y-27907]|uniref:Uncharacterized protein n=1 Tax=Spathaspora passalidarum (strain NRRL Y-27907 / 11-Y1) TaxID=619300 RepID=G3AU60_SPAPN|nr:uncharacterized protein SPAPADRAFT_157463 [Spathaspora passalidarum NRRL Y-27907]EGW30436.1 hypothetical protein SPAPADRAFT_157463 [Spathaspora passalidarum NRRL Y-27907]